MCRTWIERRSARACSASARRAGCGSASSPPADDERCACASRGLIARRRTRTAPARRARTRRTGCSGRGRARTSPPASTVIAPVGQHRLELAIGVRRPRAPRPAAVAGGRDLRALGVAGRDPALAQTRVGSTRASAIGSRRRQPEAVLDEREVGEHVLRERVVEQRPVAQRRRGDAHRGGSVHREPRPRSRARPAAPPPSRTRRRSRPPAAASRSSPLRRREMVDRLAQDPQRLAELAEADVDARHRVPLALGDDLAARAGGSRRRGARDGRRSTAPTRARAGRPRSTPPPARAAGARSRSAGRSSRRCRGTAGGRGAGRARSRRARRSSSSSVDRALARARRRDDHARGRSGCRSAARAAA